MNEADDYNFGIAENSNLSSLFGKENSFSIGNSSLVYKARKQPANDESKDIKAASTNFYYKYIILYEIIAEKEHELGKYITGLLTSDSNGSQILIYQNKRNILIRGDINACSVSMCNKNFAVTLMISERKWLLEFKNKKDYSEFFSEFSKLGGKLTHFVGNDQSQNAHFGQKKNHSQLNLSYLESDSSVINSAQTLNDSLNIESFDNSNYKDINSRREKEDILTRLAKIGLPLLPSLHKEIENDVSLNDTDVLEERKNTKIEIPVNSSSLKTKEQSSDENYHQIVSTQKDIAPIKTKGDMYPLQENSYNIGHTTNQIQTLNSNMQIDPISLILAENRIANTELKQYISLLNSKLDSITNFKESDDHGVQNQLKSKIRALEIKSENLQDELNRYQYKCDELTKINNQLAFKLENNQRSEETTCIINKAKSSQTNFTEEILDVENIDYKSQVITILKFVESLPLESVEFDLTQLKSLKDSIKDEELLSNFNSCINFLQEKICSQKNTSDNIDETRNNFIKETKKIMIDMYSTISCRLSEHSDTKSIFAEQVRKVTAELVRNFDKSVQNIKKH